MKLFFVLFSIFAVLFVIAANCVVYYFILTIGFGLEVANWPMVIFGAVWLLVSSFIMAMINESLKSIGAS